MKKFTIMSIIFLAACAPMEPSSYARGDAPEKQFKQDDYQCELNARQTPGNSCAQMDMYEKCMSAKGYSAIPGSGNKGMCAKAF